MQVKRPPPHESAQTEVRCSVREKAPPVASALGSDMTPQSSLIKGEANGSAGASPSRESARTEVRASVD